MRPPSCIEGLQRPTATTTSTTSNRPSSSTSIINTSSEGWRSKSRTQDSYSSCEQLQLWTLDSGSHSPASSAHTSSISSLPHTEPRSVRTQPSLLGASMPAVLPALPNMTALLALVPPLVPTNPLDMASIGNVSSQLEAELTNIVQTPALAALVTSPPQLSEALGSFITALVPPPPPATTSAPKPATTAIGKPAPSAQPDAPERMSLLPFSFF
ncbi:uncharacterized protein LOC126571153 [Anopheles aquasalis]|uniref:uncharacterized protein LOC126571153 n=1 Tax=Anopheles aquasalis TaxID=42839 RepID=UPI00215A706C|nr:uncharacterized protein LOC126571153 [Anopheles aquasalis]